MKLFSLVASSAFLLKNVSGQDDIVHNHLRGLGGNMDCKEYCNLYAQALQRCPSYFYQDVELDPVQGCLGRCARANFAKDDPDLSFATDSLQCRMNHARMAIKEGEITNSKHCMHATIASPGRCAQDDESLNSETRIAIGKLIFYNPSEYLVDDNPLWLSKFDALALSISYLITMRGRFFAAYPSLTEDQSGVTCTDYELRFRSADGSCNNIVNPEMGKVGTPFARNLKESSPHEDGYADVDQVAKILKRDPDNRKLAPFNQLSTAWIQFMTHDWFAHEDQNQNKVTHWWDASQIYGVSQLTCSSQVSMFLYNVIMTLPSYSCFSS